MLAELIFGFLFFVHILWAHARAKKLTRALMLKTLDDPNGPWWYGYELVELTDGAVSNAFVYLTLSELMNEGLIIREKEAIPSRGLRGPGRACLYRRAKLEKSGTVC